MHNKVRTPEERDFFFLKVKIQDEATHIKQSKEFLRVTHEKNWMTGPGDPTISLASNAYLYNSCKI